MTRAKKRKRQQSCDITKVVDTIEKAAETAMKIYRAFEPIAKAILTKGRKTQSRTKRAKQCSAWTLSGNFVSPLP